MDQAHRHQHGQGQAFLLQRGFGQWINHWRRFSLKSSVRGIGVRWTEFNRQKPDGNLLLV